MADDVLKRAQQAALTIAATLPVRTARPAIEPATTFQPTTSDTSTAYQSPGNEPGRHQLYAAPPPGPQKILKAGRTRASDGRGTGSDESSAVSPQETRSSPDTLAAAELARAREALHRALHVCLLGTTRVLFSVML